jgi:hypothetical protein
VWGWFNDEVYIAVVDDAKIKRLFQTNKNVLFKNSMWSESCRAQHGVHQRSSFGA